jgi:hypothetical protein
MSKKTNGQIWKENGGGIERTVAEAANEKGKRFLTDIEMDWHDDLDALSASWGEFIDEFGIYDECEHEWEQASGWFAGPVTWECKLCKEVKK